MAAKFLKFENQVTLLLEANTSITTISTTLNKPSSSIYNAIKRIKRKNKEFNIKKASKGRIEKLSSREKELLIET